MVAVGGGEAQGPGSRVIGLVAAGGGMPVVSREPGRLQFLRARRPRRRHALVARAARRARAARLAVLLALVRVRDAAVVQRRRVVQRPQLLVERARQRRHQVSRSCNNVQLSLGA